jgi:two-component system chemotaxis sensor kinase CheA
MKIMSARNIVEKISLTLLLADELKPAALLPEVEALRKLNLDAVSRNLLENFADIITNSSKFAQPHQAHAQALAIWESLSSRINEPAAEAPVETGSENTMQYDASHGQEILNSFFSEIGGHLQVVEQQMMRLESHPGDKEALNAVFGAMHSLKGIAGFLNVKIAHELAHEAEAVMELARKRDSGIDPAECDAIFKAVDVLRTIEDRILSHSKNPKQPLPEIPPACHPTLVELRRLARGGPVSARIQSPVSEPTRNAATNEPKAGTQIADRAGLVRVKVQKLDDLIELIGELVVTQTQIQQDSDLRSLSSPRLMRNLSQVGKITRELQSVAMSLRMYPLRDVFGRMARLARDVARKQGKDLEVIVEGEETELDKNVIEALVDPLTHLVRNAVDHGVDPAAARVATGKEARAKLTISAQHQSGTVQISVADDGRGLDTARIAAKAREKGLIGADENPSAARIQSLIFEPGFSTAEQVTEISGRGIGLDVVRRNVLALGGRVSVESSAGKSTAFVLTLPLTLAIIDGLIVRTGADRYIVPITSVLECVRPHPEHISTVQERGEVINVRGTILPLVRLSEFAAVTPDFAEASNSIVMIVECAGERFGLVVDELLGQQQIVIRNLGECLESVQGIASGAILGDGRVGLILDVEQVLRTARERQQLLAAG